MKVHEIHLSANSTASFSNHTSFCIGTGRMGLALQKEYHDQLAMAQAECSFKHIRGHGLFSDDMAIYQPYQDQDGNWHESYNFTYLDRVMDDYRSLGLKPFLELGFMPQKMASGTQTVFYWKGNVTPPQDDEKWTNLVKATLLHLAERYGREEVSSWPCEIWNEPNLECFWENADEEKYHHLYTVTARAVKSALPEMRVGGPAICGGTTSLDWVRNFLQFCLDEHLPVDFVTRHAYMGETPEHQGRYLYHSMRSVDSLMKEMQQTREIIDSFPEYSGIEMHITEFNTSYNPFCPIHDTNLNAAYMAGVLARMGDVAASYSYWTFGDVFEEQGVPPMPFHGGFGLIANGLIAKPTLWAFAFFSKLNGTPVYRDEHAVIIRKADNSYEGILWNLCHETREPLSIAITLPADGKQVLVTETVDEVTCNPLKAWHDMGEPRSLTQQQLSTLRKTDHPDVNLSTAVADQGNVKLEFLLRENAVVHFTLTKQIHEGDYGYQYDWYVK